MSEKALTDRIPTKELVWKDWRFGVNGRMFEHFTKLAQNPYFEDGVDWMETHGSRTEMIYAGMKQVMDDLSTSFSLPNVDVDELSEKVRVKVDDDGFFEPPYEMEHLSSLLLYVFLTSKAEDDIPYLEEGTSGKYEITGNLKPSSEELWDLFTELFARPNTGAIAVNRGEVVNPPKRRKYWDYHIQ